MDLTTQTPVEIDTRLSDLQIEGARLVGDLDLSTARIYSQADLHPKGAKVSPYARTTPGTLEEALAIVETKVADADLTSRYHGVEYEINALAALLAAREAFEANLAEQAPLHAEFERRGGWTRAFLVLNTNGHVHSSMYCSTCYDTTRYGWLPQVSGATEDEIVAGAGSDACTVCYPSAPVETAGARTLLHVSEEEAAQARAVKAQEKAARLQKKIDKSLTADGSELVVSWQEGNYHDGSPRRQRERFATEQAASQWLVGLLADAQASYRSSYYTERLEQAQEAVQTVLEAMAAKHGETVEQVRERLAVKVAAKIKRDARG